MITEVIFTGTELLLGQILNTNAQYLQQALASHGFDLYHQVTVGDNLERCAEAIRQAAARAEVIFIGGGLGPTEDDVSREALSLALGLPWFRTRLPWRSSAGFIWPGTFPCPVPT